MNVYLNDLDGGHRFSSRAYGQGECLFQPRHRMKKREIDAKFHKIVQFLDTPVKRFSSGMYVRLAFAVATHMDPEILLVDDVLAVGAAA